MSTSNNSGISLLSVVVMIGILSISLTVTRILLYKQTNAQRALETRNEMEEIYEAMMGNRENGTFGYVGDMGVQPASLNDLIVNPLASPAVTGTNGVKTGWNGPYINTGRDVESYKEDAWGNDYTLVGISQIRSNGPDGESDTPDDIVHPTKPVNSVTGSLILKIPKGGVLCNVSDINEIVVYYFDDIEGIEKSKSLGIDFNLSDVQGKGFYTTDPIPLSHGIHAVKVSNVTGKTIFANAVVSAESTNTQIVGTLPYKGLDLHPQLPPHISLDNDRVVEIDIVNTTGCQEGEGAYYDVSRIDAVEVGGVGSNTLLEISFNDDVVFTGKTSISNDIENPTTITLSTVYRLQPGKALNKLEFLNAVSPANSFILIYHYTDTVEPNILRTSTISFQPQGL